MNIRCVTALCVALVVALPLAGCRGRGDAKAQEYTDPTLRAVTVVDSSIVLPFAQYSLPAPDLERIADGTVRLLERCLADRGIAIPDDAYLGGDFVAAASNSGETGLFWGGPFGTLDESQAQRYGYHAAPGGPTAFGPSFYLKSADNVSLGGWGSPQAERVQEELDGPLDGAPVTGKPTCRAEVEAKIDARMPDLSDWIRDTHNLAMAHPQVAPTVETWARCMSDSGYPGFKRVGDASMSMHLQKVSEKEIALAVQDVRCTRESRWADYYYAAVAEYQKQAIAHHPDVFSGALSAARKRADSIASLLDGEPAP